MENALLVGLSRQVALGRELDVIANNLANVTTNGFKARGARFSEYLSSPAKADGFQKPDQRLGFVIDAGASLDISTGAIERTGNPLDVAAKGDVFFAVQTPSGERYTRDGSFAVDATGQLVTQGGDPVLGDSGPITFSPQESGAAIATDGGVSTSQGQRGRLRLVRFADPGRLTNEGGNLFASAEPAQAAGPTGRVEIGAVERSNVRPILQITRLMEVNRSYANVASMMTRMDETKRSALSRLADVGNA